MSRSYTGWGKSIFLALFTHWVWSCNLWEWLLPRSQVVCTLLLACWRQALCLALLSVQMPCPLNSSRFSSSSVMTRKPHGRTLGSCRALQLFVSGRSLLFGDDAVSWASLPFLLVMAWLFPKIWLRSSHYPSPHPLALGLETRALCMPGMPSPFKPHPQPTFHNIMSSL